MPISWSLNPLLPGFQKGFRPHIETIELSTKKLTEQKIRNSFSLLNDFVKAFHRVEHVKLIRTLNEGLTKNFLEFFIELYCRQIKFMKEDWKNSPKELQEAYFKAACFREHYSTPTQRKLSRTSKLVEFFSNGRKIDWIRCFRRQSVDCGNSWQSPNPLWRIVNCWKQLVHVIESEQNKSGGFFHESILQIRIGFGKELIEQFEDFS